jgi:hypothetical protein
MGVSIFLSNFLWSAMLSQIYTYIRIHARYLLFLTDFKLSFEFLAHFRKILKCQISWKSFHLMPSSSMRTDAMTRRRLQSHFAALRTRLIKNCMTTSYTDRKNSLNYSLTKRIRQTLSCKYRTQTLVTNCHVRGFQLLKQFVLQKAHSLWC